MLMNRCRAEALERVLHTLIESGDAEAFLAVVRRINASKKAVVRFSVEPPLDEGAFNAASHARRFFW